MLCQDLSFFSCKTDDNRRIQELGRNLFFFQLFDETLILHLFMGRMLINDKQLILQGN